LILVMEVGGLTIMAMGTVVVRAEVMVMFSGPHL
jgi:hypothetical protein